MQETDVVALVECIDEDLPVHGLVRHLAVVQVVAFEIPAREIRSHSREPRLDVEIRGAIRGGCRQHPDHAVFLGERQGLETRPFRADAGKGILLGQAAQRSVVAIGPAMIGTGEGAGAAAAFGNLGAAMATDIEEGA
ncbi:MAG: hypothetical protein R3D68_17025 [Hyphomicrobiaceae bacterium]